MVRVVVKSGDEIVEFVGNGVVGKREVPTFVKLAFGDEYKISEFRKFKKKRKVYKVLGEKVDEFEAYMSKDEKFLVIIV